jgi:hypothetical protein
VSPSEYRTRRDNYLNTLEIAAELSTIRCEYQLTTPCASKIHWHDAHSLSSDGRWHAYLEIGKITHRSIVQREAHIADPDMAGGCYRVSRNYTSSGEFNEHEFAK